MIRIASLRSLLAAPSVYGHWALFGSVLAIAVPTIVRASVDGYVVGVGVTPYVPFVLLSAIFLGWRYAAFVTMVSAAIADWLFIGPSDQFLEGPTDLFAIGFFFFASALVIGFVEAMRRPFEAPHSPGAGERASPGGIIFSLEKGQAWASWQGGGLPIRLGPEWEVAEMMEDFLAQRQLGMRLTGQAR